MTFDEFLQLTPKIAKVSLPATESHLKMSPVERRLQLLNHDYNLEVARDAAVMMLIYPDQNAAKIALIVRNSYKGVHSSQVAFPGGKVEKNESTLTAALRETHEEIGVEPNDINIVRAFSNVFIPPSNFNVYPFLGFCSSQPTFVPDPREVSAMALFSLEDILDDGNLTMQRVEASYSTDIVVPAFKVDNTIIWGATAMMLQELKDVLNSIV
ncbi:MAG: NUDIX hydrolase [Flavobacterium sp.]